ncbi:MULTISPECIES: hypothetical protein [unclassified Butyrivibrio]|uniref:hypothetical protein n=1 Tax=unclassified Butyrivibrio TaxID=2639466 RepID=UPI00047B84D0|nr:MULTISPECIES: hypothetical protein [unclassified Butyrivibrio]SEL81008.1 hypothetical protein SAMN04487770_1186 [Butyrivibrio sp. ob235]
MYSFRSIRRSLFGNLAGTIFLALFGAIYEMYSHGVYSYFMIYAFAVPLIMGVLPYMIMHTLGKTASPIFINLWNSAIATLSVGSVFAGVLAIYGTTNKLLIIYPIAGAVLILGSVISLVCNHSHIGLAGQSNSNLS